MVTGKRYQVFSIKETKQSDGKVTSVWVRAGSAWVNRDVMRGTLLCGGSGRSLSSQIRCCTCRDVVVLQREQMTPAVLQGESRLTRTARRHHAASRPSSFAEPDRITNASQTRRVTAQHAGSTRLVRSSTRP